MKPTGWMVLAGPAIAVVLLGSSCGTKPGIEILEQPVVRSDGKKVTLDGKTLPSSARSVLKREGLSRLARKDPAETIRRLDKILSEKEQSDVRFAAAALALARGDSQGRKANTETLGYFLTAIEMSEPGLAGGEYQPYLTAIYSEANAALASLVHGLKLGPGQEFRVAGPLKTYRVAWKSGGDRTVRAGYYDTLTPVSYLDVQGFEKSNSRPGVGGALVGYRKGTEERRAKEPFMPNSGYAVPVTATTDFRSGGRARIALHDGLVDEQVTVSGNVYPLAADYTAAVATAVAASPSGKVGWVGMLRPEKNVGKEGLFLLEPYRDNRIPLILVHGLLSTPHTWDAVINACYGDPVIRRNYQILTFFYPTGFPIVENASTLRARLKAFQQKYDPGRRNPKMREMVMVGHSMGCNLTNFQIRDGGDSLYYKFFDKSIGEIETTSEFKQQMKRDAYFTANPDIDRVVFVCGPHRGSPLSNAWLGRFGAKLIHIPFSAADAITGNVLNSTTKAGRSVLSESNSSINNLEVNSPILLAILEQPMPDQPTMHSIIGDRGKDEPLKDSSDGVVPYWSSHLDGVKSEKMIPASHTTATANPENVQEIRRILRLHVGKGTPVATVGNSN
jgi:hypothetical protein